MWTIACSQVNVDALRQPMMSARGLDRALGGQIKGELWQRRRDLNSP
jgi:hypothetical protein